MYSVIRIYHLGLGGGEKPSLKQQSTKLNCEIGFMLVFPVYAMGLAVSQQLKCISVITTLRVSSQFRQPNLNMSISIICDHVLSRITPQIFFLYHNILVTPGTLVISTNGALQCKPTLMESAILFSEATLPCLKLLVNAMVNSIPAEQGTDLQRL